MTKDDFLIELNEFQNELQDSFDENTFDWSDHYGESDLSILPVQSVQIKKKLNWIFYPIFFNVRPSTSTSIGFTIDSKPIFDIYEIKSPVNNWNERDSYAFEFAQRWNKTVYDLMKETITDRYKTTIEIFDLFFDEYLIKIDEYKSFIDETVIKKDRNDALYIIADDMREQVKEGKFTTFREAYEFASRHYESFGKSFTGKSLEAAYIREKDRGRIG